MPVNNRKVTAPVSFSDVNTALGTSITDLASLCLSQSINKWAKYKPVDWPSVDTTNEWDFANNTWKSTSGWWKGAEQLGSGTNACGLRVNSYTSPATLISKYADEWAYIRPSGGINSPYRLTDFAGYNHLATSFLLGLDGGGEYYTNQQVRITANWNNEQSDDSVSLDLIDHNGTSVLSDYYFGLLYKVGNYYYIMTSESRMSSDAYTARVVLGMMAEGNYTVYPILSYTSYGSITRITSATSLYTLPTTPIALVVNPISLSVNYSIINYLVMLGAGRFTVSFNIYATSQSGNVPITDLMVTIYGSSTYGGKDTQLYSGSFGQTITATSSGTTSSLYSRTVMSTSYTYITTVVSSAELAYSTQESARLLE